MSFNVVLVNAAPNLTRERRRVLNQSIGEFTPFPGVRRRYPRPRRLQSIVEHATHRAGAIAAPSSSGSRIVDA